MFDATWHLDLSPSSQDATWHQDLSPRSGQVPAAAIPDSEKATTSIESKTNFPGVARLGTTVTDERVPPHTGAERRCGRPCIPEKRQGGWPSSEGAGLAYWLFDHSRPWNKCRCRFDRYRRCAGSIRNEPPCRQVTLEILLHAVNLLGEEKRCLVKETAFGLVFRLPRIDRLAMHLRRLERSLRND